MKRNKSTYVTDLTFEILSNKILLQEWAENSRDIAFLGLSIEILSDTDLLYSWDCDNVLKLKLSGVLSNGKAFTTKNGMIHEIDDSYQFIMKPNSYKKLVKAMIEQEAIFLIIKEDLINQGFSLQEVNEAFRFRKMKNMLIANQKMSKYSEKSQSSLFKKFVPIAIDNFKNEIKKFYRKKAGDFSDNSHLANEVIDTSYVDNKSSNTLLYDTKSKVPFKVGLKFASGEAQKLYEKYKGTRGHFTTICVELGFKKSDRPYFSETFSRNASIKNIYSTLVLLQDIKSHCVENNIVICEEFTDELDTLEGKII